MISGVTTAGGPPNDGYKEDVLSLGRRWWWCQRQTANYVHLEDALMSTAAGLEVIYLCEGPGLKKYYVNISGKFSAFRTLGPA